MAWKNNTLKNKNLKPTKGYLNILKFDKVISHETQKAQVRKLDLMKDKNVCSVKDPVKMMKKKSTD